ncbi:MAG: TolC family protein [Marinoscillum sp.]
MIKTLLLLFTVTGAFQEPDSTLSAEEAVSIALEKNFDIRLEKFNLDISKNNNTYGNAGFFPTVDIGAGASQSIRNTDQTLDFGEGPVQQSQSGAKNTNYNAGINLEWTVFDGLKMFATKEKLDQFARANQSAFKAQIQNVISDVLKAFYNAALEQERLSLLQSTLELSEERVVISKNKYEVGKASKLEFLQAQVDFNTDQSAYVRQQEVIALRKYELQQLLGITPISDSISLKYSYELEFVKSRGEAEDIALIQNPDLQFLLEQKEVSILTTKELERERLPSLDFNLGYNYSKQESEVGVLRSNQATGFNYGVTASMTLFDGMNQHRNIQNAKIQSEQAMTMYDRAKAQLITSVRSAFMTYQNAVTLADLETKNLEVAQENIEIALERYRVGKSNPLEIREAQNNAVDAKIRQLEAINTAKIAEIELMRLTGEILKD